MTTADRSPGSPHEESNGGTEGAPRPRCAAVILAAGSGTRVGADGNKVLLHLVGVPVLSYSVRTALTLSNVHRLVVVIRPEDRALVEAATAPLLGSHDAWIVTGGKDRHDSEWHALAALRDDIDAGEVDVVAIHDAARPLASATLWRDVIAAADHDGAAIPVSAVPPLSYRNTRPVGGAYVAVSTPQAFQAQPLLAAYEQARVDDFAATDTAGIWTEYDGRPVRGVPSTPENFKITFAEDVPLAERLLSD